VRIAASLIATLVLSACARIPALSSNARYVAMGSSFAAGTGINGIKPGTPPRCARSASNYATLVAGRLSLPLDDQTCSGATTAHILGAWSELPAQVEAVNADTRLVTITIGGNDVGYVMNLFAASCLANEGFMYQGVKRPCPTIRPPKAEDFFVQYVKLVPETPCAASQLSPEGALVTRDIGEQLARVTARAALAEGAEVLAADQFSRGHTLCDADKWSVGPKPGGTEAPAPWHPTAAGHAAIAAELEALVTGSRTRR
jgi:GDSL-like Lipase/Acylhydrolase family